MKLELHGHSARKFASTNYREIPQAPFQSGFPPNAETKLLSIREARTLNKLRNMSYKEIRVCIIC